MLQLLLSLFNLKTVFSAPDSLTGPYYKYLDSVFNEVFSDDRIKEISTNQSTDDSKNMYLNRGIMKLLECEATLLHQCLITREKYHQACRNLEELYIKYPEINFIKNSLVDNALKHSAS